MKWMITVSPASTKVDWKLHTIHFGILYVLFAWRRDKTNRFWVEFWKPWQLHFYTSNLMVKWVWGGTTHKQHSIACKLQCDHNSNAYFSIISQVCECFHFLWVNICISSISIKLIKFLMNTFSQMSLIKMQAISLIMLVVTIHCSNELLNSFKTIIFIEPIFFSRTGQINWKPEKQWLNRLILHVSVYYCFINKC